jgi:hypothetical protein
MMQINISVAKSKISHPSFPNQVSKDYSIFDVALCVILILKLRTSTYIYTHYSSWQKKTESEMLVLNLRVSIYLIS